jgi:hypothetical protein
VSIFVATTWTELVNCWWNKDNVCFLLDQHIKWVSLFSVKCNNNQQVNIFASFGYIYGFRATLLSIRVHYGFRATLRSIREHYGFRATLRSIRVLYGFRATLRSIRVLNGFRATLRSIRVLYGFRATLSLFLLLNAVWLAEKQQIAIILFLV